MVELLTKQVRTQMATLIVAALGFLLALQYNEYFKNVLDSFLPPTEGFGSKALILAALTITIVYGSVYIKKGLVK